MSEVTIAELASCLGVSKTAINQKLNRKDKEKYFRKVGNKFLINEEGQELIKSLFLSRNEVHKNDSEILVYLKESRQELISQINIKDKQIIQLQESLRVQQSLLDQQQQLQLQTQQLLEEKTILLETLDKKKWYQFWR